MFNTLILPVGWYNHGEKISVGQNFPYKEYMTQLFSVRKEKTKRKASEYTWQIEQFSGWQFLELKNIYMICHILFSIIQNKKI